MAAETQAQPIYRAKNRNRGNKGDNKRAVLDWDHVAAQCIESATSQSGWVGGGHSPLTARARKSYPAELRKPGSNPYAISLQTVIGSIKMAFSAVATGKTEQGAAPTHAANTCKQRGTGPSEGHLIPTLVSLFEIQRCMIKIARQ